ncbi:bifunctional 23S rRNA (guanine(2069)-N(7))-methyltransferase RlmK/23S rRNA (guanine(2445)-N(2))-methyltransferase RlmL [Alteromonas sediminis]|uniref:Ribosomal RNA large subunit methyltransferase K/L n=1 Tax=Alteromonas sediminis TaxID=2259342 RepID=A0A3N5Y174_9ALTE|nr:bifunctional 23S rRNA (guanine(2069)-N(7))-methyltransferase RlmK/23S rRNA (guanine(2445)-N(2))-methyltransferase RlmL [Alteromonas sediminis]RPJ67342.1 bifunctional 23S rRNA (guanine(2069)-N(7))-methyltransferase RlmK/23S rRNA (guanine(2445)-N(2))-methyltransferase RlmL [Alteromonas sediminis]
MSMIHVTTSKGLDTLLDDEIHALLPDVTTKMSPGCISFEGTLEDAYTLCLWSRLANRVLWQLAEGKVNDAEDLYQLAADIDWSMQFKTDSRFMVQFNGTNRAIQHTQFGAQKTKDAIVDHFSENGASRPSIDTKQPDISVFVRLRREQCQIGIDLSGRSLHQRHYREAQGDAPLKEHVAAAMLMRSGWTENKTLPLVDPMCGSGTIAIEAALIATNVAPGLNREVWGFSYWLQHNANSWLRLREAALNAKTECECKILASDSDKRLVIKAKKNADNAGVFSLIQFSHRDALQLTPADTESGFIVSNPPYGERLSELAQLVPLFTQWGKHLKQEWSGWHVSLLSSNRDLLRTLKLRADKEYAVMNGKLECKLVNYALVGDNLEIIGNDAEHPFSNRLKKNIKRLKPWLKTQDTECYRIYDADLPEYNVAVDRYGDYYVVQEYAPPKTIDEQKARRRLQDVLLYLPAALGINTDKIVLKVREQQKGKAQYEKVSQTEKRITVRENGARFLVNLWDYLDTGLFLDHRETRQIIKKEAKNKDVLNLFSYTGSVSVMAALGGARSVTTVDMSNTYLQWAKDNFRENHITGPHAFIQADCLSWLKSHKGKYGLVFVDPPSFSNSKRMQTTWDVQRDHLSLLVNAAACLNEEGTLMFSNNKRGFKLDVNGLQQAGLIATEITEQTIPEDYKRRGNIHKCWSITRAH